MNILIFLILELSKLAGDHISSGNDAHNGLKSVLKRGTRGVLQGDNPILSLSDTLTIFSELKALGLLAIPFLACVKKPKDFMFPQVLINRAFLTVCSNLNARDT